MEELYDLHGCHRTDAMCAGRCLGGLVELGAGVGEWIGGWGRAYLGLLQD